MSSKWRPVADFEYVLDEAFSAAGIADLDVLFPEAFDRVNGNLLSTQQIFQGQ